MPKLSDQLKKRSGSKRVKPAVIRITERAEKMALDLAEQEFIQAAQVKPDLATKLDTLSGKAGDVWLSTYGAASYCGRVTGNYSANWNCTILENRRTQRDAKMASVCGRETPPRGNVKRRGLLPVYHHNRQPYYAVSDLEKWLASATVH